MCILTCPYYCGLLGLYEFDACSVRGKNMSPIYFFYFFYIHFADVLTEYTE